MLGQLTSAIGGLGGDIRGLDIVRVDRGAIVRDVTVLAADEDHAQQLVEMMKSLAGVEVLDYSDRTFLAHLGGKIEVVPRTPIRTREDLSMVYTPGVARISMAIDDLLPEYIIPSVFNRAVAPAVAAAVAGEAASSGLAHALADLVDPLHAGEAGIHPTG
jgi:malic enzyme